MGVNKSVIEEVELEQGSLYIQLGNGKHASISFDVGNVSSHLWLTTEQLLEVAQKIKIALENYNE